MKKGFLLFLIIIVVDHTFSQVCPTVVNHQQYNETPDFGGANENPAITPFTYTFTPGAGSNRLLILFITYETETGNGPNDFAVISFGGKPLTNAVNQFVSGAQHNRLAIYYLKESDIAIAAGNTVSISFANPNGVSPDGSIRGIAVNTILLETVDQTTPLLHIQSNTNTNIMTITVPAAFSASNGNLMLAVVNMALSTETVGPSTPDYTVFTSKQVAGSHTHSVSYKHITSTSSEQPGFTASTTTRQIIGSVEVNASSTGGTCNILLPLHLISFTGILNNNSVNLDWKVAEESDITVYRIEKSADVSNGFSVIGSLTARNSSLPTEYSFTDVMSQSGPVFYRLQIVDKNGSVTYSNIVKVSNSYTNSITVISPFSSQINIYSRLLNRQNAVITLSDNVGEYILQKKVALERGLNTFEWPVNHFLAMGLYLLTVQTDNKTETFKIIRE